MKYDMDDEDFGPLDMNMGQGNAMTHKLNGSNRGNEKDNDDPLRQIGSECKRLKYDLDDPISNSLMKRCVTSKHLNFPRIWRIRSSMIIMNMFALPPPHPLNASHLLFHSACRLL